MRRIYYVGLTVACSVLGGVVQAQSGTPPTESGTTRKLGGTPPTESGGAPTRNTVYSQHGKTITKVQYDALKLVDQGVEYLHQGKDKEFLEATEKAVAMAPELATVQAAYGTALGKSKRYDEAREHLVKALGIDENNPPAWCALAAVYTSLGNNEEALKCYDTYLKKFPNDKNFQKVQSIVALVKAGSSTPSQDNADDYYDLACGANPHKWPMDKMPLNVYLAPGAGHRGYRDNFEDIVKASFKDWSDASNGQVSFRFVDSPSKAQIKVAWTDKSTDLEHPGMGSQTSLYERNGELTAAEIKLLSTELTQAYLSDTKLKGRALQEVGHSIGIEGYSKSPHDAMYFSETINGENAALSARDKKTIQRLYPGK